MDWIGLDFSLLLSTQSKYLPNFFITQACLSFFDCLTAKSVITEKCLQDRIIAKFVSFVKELATYLNLKKLLKHEVKFLALSTNTEHDFDLRAVCTHLLACFVK